MNVCQLFTCECNPWETKTRPINWGNTQNYITNCFCDISGGPYERLDIIHCPCTTMATHYFKKYIDVCPNNDVVGKFIHGFNKDMKTYIAPTIEKISNTQIHVTYENKYSFFYEVEPKTKLLNFNIFKGAETTKEYYVVKNVLHYGRIWPLTEDEKDLMVLRDNYPDCWLKTATKETDNKEEIINKIIKQYPILKDLSHTQLSELIFVGNK